MTYIRLNKNADNIAEVTQYYEDRARQLISSDFFWNKRISEVSVFGIPIGVTTGFYHRNKEYTSAYVYESARGHGNYLTLVNNKEHHIVTVPDCHLVDYLIKKSFDFTVVNPLPPETFKAYELITKAYGNTIAKRSGLPYMNHVDEGVFILKTIGANSDAIGGFMLHPIFQVPVLEEKYGEEARKNLDACQVSIAIEYARVANAYLSYRKIDKIEEIELSPCVEVNQMLIADKIQNFKDFMIYHSDSHDRAAELYEYFYNWFKRLNLSSNKVEKIIQTLRSIEKDD